MKTTVELPDKLLREAKSFAAQRGISLRQFLIYAIEDRLRKEQATAACAPWMRHFGAVDLSKDEVHIIHQNIEQAFETIDLRDWE